MVHTCDKLKELESEMQSFNSCISDARLSLCTIIVRAEGMFAGKTLVILLEYCPFCGAKMLED